MSDNDEREREIRESADYVVKTIDRRIPQWERWFPNELSEVEIPRCDLLKLVEGCKLLAQLDAAREESKTISHKLRTDIFQLESELQTVSADNAALRERVKELEQPRTQIAILMDAADAMRDEGYRPPNQNG